MTTHSSTLAWKIPWTEEPGRLQSMGLRRVGRLSDFTFTFHFHAERLHFRFSLSCIGEGNGNPLQCSCLDNPRDGGAIYGVAQSWTRLKWLSSNSSSSNANNSGSYWVFTESGILPPFSHSFKKYLLWTYYASGTFLRMKDASKNETNILVFFNLALQ